MKICRPHHSPYFKEDFISREKARLEALAKNLSYTNNFSTDVDILITDTHIKPQDFDLKNIKLAIHPNSGFDNLLSLKKLPYSFPVILGNEIRAHAVANYILTALHEHTGKLPLHNVWDKSRSFERILLKHKTIQLIGFGQIGNIVYHSLKDLCKKILIYDPFKDQQSLNISEADIIICCASLSRSAHQIINEKMINQFKDNVLLINPARGKLIDQKSLIVFLNNHPNAYAYLDVFNEEPSDFTTFPKNTYLSSHIAGVNSHLDEDTIDFEERVILDFLHMNKTNFSLTYQKILLENNPVYLYE